MCLNCGCGQPENEQGDSANITYGELQKAAQANGMSVDQTIQNIVDEVGKIEGHDPMSQQSQSGQMGSQTSYQS